jgi:DNA-binding LacI/PurR family transcriptional regulator
MGHAHEEAAAALLRHVQCGQLRAGDVLPPVDALAEAFHYSRDVLASALTLLSERGYLETHDGQAYVRNVAAGDRLAILIGGSVASGGQSSFSQACLAHASAAFERCGMVPCVYFEDAAADHHMPPALVDELRHGRVRGLLTVQSSFAFRYMQSTDWKQRPLPHVDIGSLPTRHRVYIDYAAFIRQAVMQTRRSSRRHPVLLTRGCPISAGALDEFAKEWGVRLWPAARTARDADDLETWGREMVQRLRSAGEPVDALIIAEEHIARGAALALAEARAAAPDDIEFLVLVNAGIDPKFPAPVARFAVDPSDLVASASEMMMALMQNPRRPPEVRVLAPRAVADRHT